MTADEEDQMVDLIGQMHNLINSLRTKKEAEDDFLRQLQSMCGIPDPAEACRLIIERIDKFLDEE